MQPIAGAQAFLVCERYLRILSKLEKSQSTWQEIKMIYLADSATKLPDEVGRSVLVCGSHGGLYPGYLVAKAGIAAVIFNDAGVGKDAAGIASLCYLEALNIAAATVSNISCRIGDVSDMTRRGRISHANALAASLGVTQGDDCSAAAEKLMAAKGACRVPEPVSESRKAYESSGPRSIVLIDSASLVRPEDANQIVVTGSHGGLVGGNPAKALQVNAFAAVFHDAGIGIENAGVTRLPALDERGIAAVTVSAASARIGDALSICEEGVISFANESCPADWRSHRRPSGRPSAAMEQAIKQPRGLTRF